MGVYWGWVKLPLVRSKIAAEADFFVADAGVFLVKFNCFRADVQKARNFLGVFA
jgi:hypothetical protein